MNAPDTSAVTAAPLSLRARWIFPVDAPPVSDGTLHLQNGRVVGLTSGTGPCDRDLGDAAIIPALVNAHTHLEFSELSCPLPCDGRFAEWIRAVVDHRRRRLVTPADAIQRGYRECTATGTSTIGEIATDAASGTSLSGQQVRAVVFRELLGRRPGDVETQLALARQYLAAGDADPPGLRRGLSPHAPYTVHPDLLQGVVDLVRGTPVPVAMHLAETREELELLDRGTGPLVDLLRSMGHWDTSQLPRGTTVLDFLQPLAALNRILVIHGNYLNSCEIDFLAQHPQFAVVYCPRTHHHFGHPEHPWKELLDRGVMVALGTDSRASNPDLSLWEELRFLREHHPDIPGETLLRLGTLAGAEALGCADQTGSLTPGKSADLCVIETSQPLNLSPQSATYAALFAPGSFVAATMHAGHWVNASSAL